jgi:hypothetical protein
MTMSAISLPSSLSRGAPARVAPGSRRGPRRVAARQPACRGRRATRCVASAGEERITVIGEALWAGPVHVRRSLPGIPRVPVLRHPTVTQARWSGSPNPPPVCPASRRARSARPSINPDSIALRGYERRYSPFQGPCRPYDVLILGEEENWRSLGLAVVKHAQGTARAARQVTTRPTHPHRGPCAAAEPSRQDSLPAQRRHSPSSWGVLSGPWREDSLPAGLFLGGAPANVACHLNGRATDLPGYQLPFYPSPPPPLSPSPLSSTKQPDGAIFTWLTSRPACGIWQSSN